MFSFIKCFIRLSDCLSILDIMEKRDKNMGSYLMALLLQTHDHIWMLSHACSIVQVKDAVFHSSPCVRSPAELSSSSSVWRLIQPSAYFSVLRTGKENDS